MKTKKNKKSGFTLVELMVVAIIVAIMAAVAIPLMSGNKDRAMATEAQTACGSIAGQIQLDILEEGTNTVQAYTSASELSGISLTDLDGAYFKTANYVLDITSPSDIEITATGYGKAAGGTVVMTKVAGVTTWSGSLLD